MDVEDTNAERDTAETLRVFMRKVRVGLKNTNVKVQARRNELKA